MKAFDVVVCFIVTTIYISLHKRVHYHVRPEVGERTKAQNERPNFYSIFPLAMAEDQKCDDDVHRWLQFVGAVKLLLAF